MEKAAETALDKLVDILRLSPRYLFLPLLLISAFALFAPADWLDVLGIRSLVADYKPWVGGTFLVSIAFVLVSLGHAVYSWSWGSITSNRRKTEQLDRMKEKLDNLTNDEKDRLGGFIRSGTRVQYFYQTDVVALGLASPGGVFHITRRWFAHLL